MFTGKNSCKENLLNKKLKIYRSAKVKKYPATPLPSNLFQELKKKKMKTKILMNSLKTMMNKMRKKVEKVTKRKVIKRKSSLIIILTHSLLKLSMNCIRFVQHLLRTGKTICQPWGLNYKFWMAGTKKLPFPRLS